MILNSHIDDTDLDARSAAHSPPVVFAGDRGIGETAGGGEGGRFAPITRMVLANDGSTTRLLEAALGVELALRVLSQEIVSSGGLGADVGAALGLVGAEDVLLRRSSLVGPLGRPASFNVVVGRRPHDRRLGPIMADSRVPIGYGLEGVGEPRREIVETGVARWRGVGGDVPCAFKKYVIRMDGEPVLLISEFFDPELLPVGSGVCLPRRGGVPELAEGVGWSPGSWRAFPVGQAPGWRDGAEAEGCVRRLAELPPLVRPDDCGVLREQLAEAGEGRAFVLQMGDCSETFAGLSGRALESWQALFALCSLTVSFRTGLPVVAIGRIAGQYAKPRSSAVQRVRSPEGGVRVVPEYRGDMINGFAPEVGERRPDPGRMVQAYLHSAVSLHHLGSHRVAAGGAAVADLLAMLAPCEGLPVDLPQLLGFMGVLPPERVFTSHEALVLPYEEALTRRGPGGGWFATSAHSLWVGERTRSLSGGHVEFVSGIGNPVGVKIGPGCEPEELVELCRRVDPGRQPGRLSLVVRLGAERVERVLPGLVRAVVASGQPVVWICDPMHGNTRVAGGVKTRRVADVVAEIRAVFGVLRREGVQPGGLHLEATAEPVTECVGGWSGLTEADLSVDYRSVCDPRLNPVQVFECLAAALEPAARSLEVGA
ncbi:hypothetical protein GCM10027589_15300 [Actinocorallia lasiicapitis]